MRRDQLAAVAREPDPRRFAENGGITAKLEGMFTGGLQHWSSMDDRLESVVEKMDTAEQSHAPVCICY